MVTVGFAPRTIIGYETPLITGSVNRRHRLSCSMYGRMMTAQDGESRAPFDRPHGRTPFVSWKLCIASPICFRLFVHFMRAAASRTFCTAGRSRPIRMAMMAMTTSSSMSVNPERGRLIDMGEERDIEPSDGRACRKEEQLPHRPNTIRRRQRFAARRRSD